MQAASRQTVPLSRLVPWSGNPREARDPDLVAAIAASQATSGLVHPLLVRAASSGDDPVYEVIDGETRRLALVANMEAGLLAPDVPVVVEILDPALGVADLTEIALVSNQLRRQLSVIEEAETIESLKLAQVSERRIADVLGLSPRQVQQRLALAALVAPAKALLRSGERALGWGQAMTAATPARQTEICDTIAANPLAFPDGESVRAHLRAARIPARHALFDPATLPDALVRDLFGDEDYFEDAAAFWQAQDAAIDQRIAALAAAGTPAELHVADSFDPTGWTRCDPGPGTVTVILKYLDGRVEEQSMIPPPVEHGNLSADEEDFLGLASANGVGTTDPTSPSHRPPAPKNGTAPAHVPAGSAADIGAYNAASAVSAATGAAAPADDPLAKTSGELAKVLTGDLVALTRGTIAGSPRLAIVVLLAASLGRLGIVPQLLPTALEASGPNPHERPGRGLLANQRAARDSIVAPLALAGNNDPCTLIAKLLALPDAQLMTLFAWTVSESLTLKLDQVDIADSLGIDIASLWHVHDAYLDALTTKQVRALVLEACPGNEALADGGSRGAMTTLLRGQTGGGVLGASQPSLQWLPPQLRLAA